MLLVAVFSSHLSASLSTT